MDKNTAIELNTLSKKIMTVMNTLDGYFSDRHNENKVGVADAQNATIELSDEIDARISDLENALCELSEG